MGGKSTFSSGKEELKKYKENKEIMEKHRRSHCIKLEMKIETEEWMDN